MIKSFRLRGKVYIKLWYMGLFNRIQVSRLLLTGKCFLFYNGKFAKLPWRFFQEYFRLFKCWFFLNIYIFIFWTQTFFLFFCIGLKWFCMKCSVKLTLLALFYKYFHFFKICIFFIENIVRTILLIFINAGRLFMLWLKFQSFISKIFQLMRRSLLESRDRVTVSFIKCECIWT